MPDRTAEYWEEKAVKAVESANRMTTTELRLAFLEIAKNYREIAERARIADQWQQRK